MAVKTFRWLVGWVMLGFTLGGPSIFFFSGCSSSTSSSSSNSSSVPAYLFQKHYSTYTVQRGDTLYKIARRYHVSVSRLMSANRISDAHDVSVGQVLTIPGSYSYASLGDGLDGSSSEHPTRIFAWPVEHGVLSSGFGMREGTMHDGVDIAAPLGTPILSAEAGTVIFSGRLRGYGNVVIIRHDSEYVTIYGHDASNLVHEGESVSRGQEIATMGTSGRATGANLHFEVRRGNVAHNPLAYLPPVNQTAGITFARNGGS